MLLTAASSQYLTCANPGITDYPFTVGMWLWLTAAGSSQRTLFALSDTGTTNNYLAVNMTTAEVIGMSAAAGGAADVADTVGGVTGLWTFFLARFLSSTQRRIVVFRSGGTAYTTFSASAVARAPTNMDTMTIGCLSTSAGQSEFWDGIIAEYWLAQGDVGSDEVNVVRPLAMALALGGPFSMPYINVVDYRSFRCGFPAGGVGDCYSGGASRPNWTAVGGSAVARHPPLPYWFKRPDQVQRQLVI